MEEDKEEFLKFIGKVIFWIAVLVFGFFGIFIIGYIISHIITSLLE